MKYWIGLYLSFHLSWVLGSIVHSRLQNMKTSEGTFGHNTTPLTQMIVKSVPGKIFSRVCFFLPVELRYFN